MTKHVFNDPANVAHIWAHGGQDHARYRGNFYFQGAALFGYSYGEHFLCGYRIGVGCFAINGDLYSVTTSRHMGEVRRAVFVESYVIPSLTDLHGRRYGGASALRAIAETHGESGASKRRADIVKRARPGFLQWLGSNFADCSAESLAFLFAGLGYTEKQRDSKLASLQAKAERDAAKREKALAARALKLAKERGAMGDSEFRDSIPSDRDAGQQDSLLTDWRRSHRVASGAGLDRLKRKLWARVQELDSHIAGRSRRLRAAMRADVAREVREWRAAGKPGDAIPDSLFLMLHGARYRALNAENKLPAIMRAIRRAKAIAESESRRESFAEWQAGNGKRPYANYYEPGTPEREAIDSAIEREASEWIERATAWLADESAPSDQAPDSYPTGWHEWPDKAGQRDIIYSLSSEKAKRAAREKAEKLAAERAAWLAGTGARHAPYSDERGGALLRVRGDMLETSHGADVPLSHAIRAYPFIKGCKESGRGWKANGQRIRVGHYQLDSIDSEGNFVAGCHKISWGETERIAREVGVADRPGIAPRRTHSGPRDLADVIADNNAGGAREWY